MNTIEVETIDGHSMDGDKNGVTVEFVCPKCSRASYEYFTGNFAEYHEVGGSAPWDGTEVCVYTFPEFSTTCECGTNFTVTCDLDAMLDEMADEVNSGGSDYDYDDYCRSRDRYDGGQDHPNY